ncbi:CBO0543 family protein [Ammoniphilus sp. 3BR4]|uniref:CBO0543 family protein n=1 Tax=Ammoniphilus sp. 3BR4 TaxID=3158265 RepID=UPI00346647B5
MLFLLWRFVPRKQWRQAHVAFLFMQLMTWFLGFLTVELKLLEYPIRLFEYASRTNFTFEYFVYPSICVLFNLYYPVKSTLFLKIGYYLCYLVGITSIEVALEKYTDLITYLHWNALWTFISMLVTLFLSRKYFKWFFKFES